MILRDHAGASNYGNNANGYTVLDAGVAGIINISPAPTEAFCDRVRIYNGVGVGGAAADLQWDRHRRTSLARPVRPLTVGVHLRLPVCNPASTSWSPIPVYVPSRTQPAATVQLAPDCTPTPSSCS